MMATQTYHYVLLDGTHVLEVENNKIGSNYILIDADVYEKVKDESIRIIYNNQLKKKRYYAIIRRKNKMVLLHRFIMNPPKKEQVVDHKNTNDTLDNRRSNLRIGTQQQNTFNQSKRIGSLSSKYKGVKLDKRRGIWYSSITYCYKTISLGSFKTEIEAAIVYNDAAVKYFGEFALLNDIPYEFKSIIPKKNIRSDYKGFGSSLSRNINQYGLDGALIKQWGSITEIRRETGMRVTEMLISGNAPIRVRNRSIKGMVTNFKWEYA